MNLKSEKLVSSLCFRIQCIVPLHHGGGKKKRANVILQVLDFSKAQWERVAKKSFPNGLPGTYKERNL